MGETTGQGNQNALTLHFGLGDHSGPVEMEVTWPGGLTRNFTVDPDQTVDINPNTTISTNAKAIGEVGRISDLTDAARKAVSAAEQS